MPQVSYPGVYIQEIPSAVHTITNVGTSITAFVDFFREGPMNTACEIFGMSDFGRIFGGIDPRSDASYAIAQFFLNGGSDAIVVRCATDKGVAGPLGTATVGIKQATTGPATAVLTVSAASPGIWGNTLRVEIDAQTADPSKYFNLTISRYETADAGARLVTQEKYLKLTLDPNDPRSALSVVNGDSKLVVLTIPAGTAATAIPFACGTVGNALPVFNQGAFDTLGGSKKFRVKAGSNSAYEATLTWNPDDVKNIYQLASRLEVAIRTAMDTTGAKLPTPPSLAGATVAIIGDTKLAIRAGAGDPLVKAVDTLVFSDAGGGDTTASAKLMLTTPSNANVQQYVLGSAEVNVDAYIKGDTGGDGIPPMADALVGPVADANDEGIYALRKADLFNLLCIPRAASADLPDPEMKQVVEKSIAFCEEKRAFMLVDIPAKVNEVAEVKDWVAAHDDFRSANSAIFFPRLMIADPANEYRVRSFGASGTMAGVFARTDSDRGVWKAPAGIEATLRGVDSLDYVLTDAENGVLNPLAINCVRTFKGYGTISWGARTLFGADQRANEWKYTPVRRLALMLEESLFRGTKWVVFEPNDEPLWAKIRLNLNAYMMSLFRQGAFEGKTPKEAFYVKCDKETTTPDDQNKGIVNIEVGFAPLKPAEFVVIKIQQIAGDL